ncbi:MAG: hypothetical protein C4521_07030 [Actinobacteria bacterium]|nr:MAG: hypothetical protein C4521_07030 [Actinomycetota bacterium]
MELVSNTGQDLPERMLAGGLLLLAALVPLAWSGQTASTYFTPKFSLLGLVAIWLLLALVLGAVWFRRMPAVSTPHLLLAAFVLWSGIATLASASSPLSTIGRPNYGEGLLSILVYALLFFAASSLRWDEIRRYRLVLAFGAASVLLVLVSLLQLTGRDGTLLAMGLAGMGARGRVSGLLGNPVFLGGFVVLALPLLAGAALTARTRLLSALAGLVTLSLVFLALTSLTRAAWLGLAVAALAFSAAAFVELARRRARLLVMAVTAALLFAVLAATFGTSQGGMLSDRLASLLRPYEGSAALRPEQWKVAARMVAERPLLGWGPSQYRTGFDRYATRSQIMAEAATSDDAHNLFANTAATTGIPGVLLLASVLVAAALASWKTVGEKDGDERVLAGATLASCAGYLAWVQFEPSSVGVTPLFWLLAGTLLSTGTSKRTTEAAEAQTSFALSIGAVGLALLLAIFPIRYLLADQSELTGIVMRSTPALEAAVSLNPLVPDYYSNLAKAYRREAETSGRLELMAHAHRALDEAEMLSAEFDVYLQRGKVHLSTAQLSSDPQEYRLAVRSLKKALSFRPLSAMARTNLGLAYLLMKEYAPAERYLKEATRLPPPDAQSFVLLARSYEGMERKRDAYEAYRQALLVDPKHQEARRSAKLLLLDAPAAEPQPGQRSRAGAEWPPLPAAP